MNHEAEYARLHDHSGRGENDLVKRLKLIKVGIQPSS
jgi:hypothetical protein